MSHQRRLAVGAGLLATVTLAVYAPVIGFDFISFDDPVYVTANSHVRAGLTPAGVLWAFGATHAANWHPLTWLSHMADVTLWGMWPGGHHLTSVVLHAAAAVLLFVALTRATGRAGRSLVVAALFALHPTRVESVAWIAERKDVLSAVFWFATLAAYARYTERRTVGTYGLVIVLYAAGLLAKPMLVTLPCTLLLFDYWPLGRLRPGGRPAARAAIVEKLPLFGLAAGASMATAMAQRAGGSVVGLDAVHLGGRIANALVAYVRYGAMLVWPSRLAFFYPLAPVDPAAAAGAGTALVAITVACLAAVRRSPYLAVGWLWFLGTLVPVIGLVQVGQQSMADRYTYVPAVGLFLAAVWGLADLAERWRARRWIPSAAALAVLVGCAAATIRQSEHWRDSEAVFRRALEVTTDNYVAHMNVGHLAMKRGDWGEAETHYRAALAIKPAMAAGYASLGNVLMAEERDADARAALERAIALDPALPEALNALGLLAVRSGDVATARARFERAVAARPAYGGAWSNLGDLLARAGDVDGAIARYRQGVAAAPDDAALALRLGTALLAQGDARGALAPLAAARASAPDDADVAYMLGTALLLANDVPGAIDALGVAVGLDPRRADAHHHLAAALGSAGRLDEALAEIERALAIDPDLIEAYRSAATTLVRAGRPDEARGWLARGVERARRVGDTDAAAELAAEMVRVSPSAAR